LREVGIECARHIEFRIFDLIGALKQKRHVVFRHTDAEVFRK